MRVWYVVPGFAILLALVLSVAACGPSDQCRWDDDCNPKELCLNGVCKSSTDPGKDGGPVTDRDTTNPVCQSGHKRKCYDGPSGTGDVGICKRGEQICVDGKWGECSNQQTPNSKEECDNGKDDNCNGVIDDGCSCKDGDTRLCEGGLSGQKGPCKQGVQSCVNGTWDTQCKGAVVAQNETCNGIDDDCDGQIDNGCPCTPGETQTCFDGPASALADGKVRGSCQLGTMTCQSDGTWGACQGSVAPKKEECNERDDNCDGQVDENCDCKPGDTRSCFSGASNTRGIGTCRDGRQTCNDKGKWSACSGEIKPKQEECNGEDDDCDGKVDEDLQGPLCGNQKGACKGARRQCNGKQGWLPCDPTVYRNNNKSTYEANEVSCDGKDNDCDGEVDESLSRSCFSGAQGCRKRGDQYECLGSCAAGSQKCIGGRWSNCLGEITPKSETCNGKDDDCNGQIDENGCQCTPGQSQNCYGGPSGTMGKGICKSGRRTCGSNGKWGACKGSQTPKLEDCNGLDDDCDGKTDENLVGPPCTKSFGACAGTRKRCAGTRGWQDCSVDDYKKNNAKYEPSEKTCDGVDNDCDGRIDENLTRSCYPASQGCVQTSTGYRCSAPCRAGTQTCSAGRWGSCSGAITAKKETCNGQDDDCNGKIDDNLVAPACSRGTGVCAGLKKTCRGVRGWQDCASSQYSSRPGYEATEVSCDGKDNDCDGQVDEALYRKCFSGTIGCTRNGTSYSCQGACRSGTQACSAGRWGSCNGEIKPKQENCSNRVDDDCNGKIDDCGSCTNGQTRSCYPSTATGCTKSGSSYSCKGVCKAGTQTCINSNWGVCSGAVVPTTENCSNGKDDNCDGRVDECSQCQTGQTRSCYTASQGCTKSGSSYTCKGGCKAGTQTCVNGAWPSTCTGQVGPTKEMCDWKDNDCDGRYDEDGACHFSIWPGIAFSTGIQQVAFLSTDIGIAVGNGGKIIRTLNSGSSWLTVSSGTSSTLYAVATQEQGLVLAVGDGGLILRSTNSGASFTRVSSGTTLSLRGVHLFSDKRAIAVGLSGTILRSTDGGATWSSSSSGTSNHLYAIAGRTTSYAVAVGAKGTIVRTQSSGSSWTSPSSGTSEDLTSVAWDIASSVMAVGPRGTVVRSTNSGQTWTKPTSPTPTTILSVVSPGKETFVLSDGSQGFYLTTDAGTRFVRREYGNSRTFNKLGLRSPTSVLAFNASSAALGEGPVRFLEKGFDFTIRAIAYNSSIGSDATLAVGSKGSILRSTDRDKTWAAVFTSHSNTFYGVAIYGTNAIAVGSGGAIYHSTDAGTSWKAVSSGVTNTLYSVALYGTNAIAVGSRNTLLRSTDGGKTWSKLTAPSPPSSTGTIYSVTAHDKTFVAAGSSGYILRSETSGSTWSKVSTGVTNTLYSVFLYPYSTRLVAVGSSGTALYSSDNGKIWSRATTGVSNTLYGVAMDWGQVVAVGTSGTLIKSSDDGKTWTKSPSLSTSTLYATYRRYGYNNYCVGGSSGILLCSDDRARTWNARRTAVTTLRDVARIGAQNYIVVGNTGLVMETRDGGQTFVGQDVPTRTYFYGVAYDSSSRAVVVAGSSGTLLRRSGTSWTSVSSGVSNTLYHVATAGANRFVVVGSTGTILVSNNGGVTFRNVTSGTSSSLYKVACNGSNCIAVGSSGTILRSTNSGDSWTRITLSMTSNTLYSVAINSSNQAVVVGRRVILYSGNGGASWSLAGSMLSETYYAVATRGRDQFVAISTAGEFIHSANAGKSWESFSPPVGGTFHGLFFLNNEGFAVGTTSTRLRVLSP